MGIPCKCHLNGLERHVTQKACAQYPEIITCHVRRHKSHYARLYTLAMSSTSRQNGMHNQTVTCAGKLKSLLVSCLFVVEILPLFCFRYTPAPAQAPSAAPVEDVAVAGVAAIEALEAVLVVVVKGRAVCVLSIGSSRRRGRGYFPSVELFKFFGFFVLRPVTWSRSQLLSG